MKNKKTIVMSTLLLAIVLLGIGTIAYFRRTVNGNITGEAGNLVLIVNEANAVDNETFEIILKRSEEENFIMPDDSGVFNLNIDSTGSSGDVGISIVISRTNLPENLKFYLDEKHTKEITNYGTVIKKSADMTKTVSIYWFWDGSVSDEDDSEFINQTISANISVTATIAKTFYETLMDMEHTLDSNIDFAQVASETNGQGLMMVNATQNDEYPILYYRGDVANNNVIYAGFCWLIVRTTETGGIKLIYNGEVSEYGSCNNYSGVTATKTYDENYINAYINKSNYAFNENYDSPVYMGYMYNDVFNISSIDDYKVHLFDNNIDSETGRHVQNLKDSTIKGVIDAWYEANIKGRPEESLLEDTVWCNDRSIISETYTLENFAVNKRFLYGAGTRLIEPAMLSDGSFTISPSLVCSRDMDKFTVDSANGNGDLDYPIGLLTADEISMAGNFGNKPVTYLSIPSDIFWTLSPFGVFSGEIGVFLVEESSIRAMIGSISSAQVAGVRTSISLGTNTYLTGGNGSFEQPYLVG